MWEINWYELIAIILMYEGAKAIGIVAYELLKEKVKKFINDYIVDEKPKSK